MLYKQLVGIVMKIEYYGKWTAAWPKATTDSLVGNGCKWFPEHIPVDLDNVACKYSGYEFYHNGYLTQKVGITPQTLSGWMW